MKVSVVVPAYNEDTTIGQVLGELGQLALDLEVIVVDDGSTDRTAAIVEASGDERIRLVRKQNGGKGTALRRGFDEAVGDIVVVQDSDIELSPARVPDLVAPIVEGRADVVYGSRFLQPVPGLAVSRRAANWLLTFLTNLLYGTRLTDMETAHKAVRADLLQAIPLVSDRFDIEVELTAKLARCGARFVEVPSPYRPRTQGQGKHIRFRDGVHAVLRILRWARWHPSPSLLSVASR